LKGTGIDPRVMAYMFCRGAGVVGTTEAAKPDTVKGNAPRSPRWKRKSSWTRPPGAHGFAPRGSSNLMMSLSRDSRARSNAVRPRPSLAVTSAL
jgi:hypothetical protein